MTQLRTFFFHRCRLLMVCAAVCCMVPASVGWSADRKAAPASRTALKSESPLHIASDRMEVSQKEKTIHFVGHVTVRQDDLVITGDQMIVYGVQEKEKSKTKSSETPMVDQIDRIEVQGSVKITQREKMATAEKAVYYHREDKIVLLGQPKVSQGQDTLQGRMITLYLADGRSVVEGGETTPVQAVLHPSRKE